VRLTDRLRQSIIAIKILERVWLRIVGT